LENGQLNLTPLKFGMAGGTLEADIALNGANTPLQGKARVKARGLRLKDLVPDFEPMQTSLGEINSDADLTGTGNSVTALLCSADGLMRLVIKHGTASRSLMEIAGLNVANFLVARIFGFEEVQIHCAVADPGFNKGSITTPIFVIATENALIEVDGTV